MGSLAIPRRIEIIKLQKEQGGTVAAVLPVYYPRSLLRAFDILPVEVWGPPSADISYGSAHIQPYVCSIVRNALSFILAGQLDIADLILVPHACDSLQGLGSLLLDFVRPRQPVLTVYIPRGRRQTDIDYLTQELHALYQRLGTLTGLAPSTSELMTSIRREEAADAVLSELWSQRRSLALADVEFYRLVRSREYLPAEVFERVALEALEQNAGPPSLSMPIILSGVLPDPPTLLEAISKAGGIVAADDTLCCGRRLYPAGTSDDPFQRMAERIIHGTPDPTRGSPIHNRAEHLAQLAKSTGARGVVFYEVKFCEPELFDLPSLRDSLQTAGIPSTVIEIDVSDGLSNQVVGRLEAFLEMVA